MHRVLSQQLAPFVPILLAVRKVGCCRGITSMYALKCVSLFPVQMTIHMAVQLGESVHHSILDDLLSALYFLGTNRDD